MTYTKNWRYIILNATSSPLTPVIVQQGLNAYPVPKYVTVTNDQTIPWHAQNWGTPWGIWPQTEQPHTGVIFYYDASTIIRDKNGVKLAPTGTSAMGGNVYGVGESFTFKVEPNTLKYNIPEIGHVIFHEIVNAYASGLQLWKYQADSYFRTSRFNNTAEFCASAMKDYRWKNDNEIYDFCNTPSSPNYTYPSSQVEHATLSYSMEKMFPLNCLPSDYNPFNAVNIPTMRATVTCINNYTQNTRMNNVKVTATFSGGSFANWTNNIGVTSLAIPCGIPVTITTKTSSYPGTTKNWAVKVATCSGIYNLTLPVGN